MTCQELADCLKVIVPAVLRATIVVGCMVGIIGILFMHYWKGMPLEGTYFKELLGVVLIESGISGGSDEAA